MQGFQPANQLNEEVLALRRSWKPDISQVRILPFRRQGRVVSMETRLFCTQELSVRIRAHPQNGFGRHLLPWRNWMTQQA